MISKNILIESSSCYESGLSTRILCFGVNKRIVSQYEGTLRTEGGKTVTYEYLMPPNIVPVYRYIQTAYNGGKIDLDEWPSLTLNPDQGG